MDLRYLKNVGIPYEAARPLTIVCPEDATIQAAPSAAAPKGKASPKGAPKAAAKGAAAPKAAAKGGAAAAPAEEAGGSGKNFLEKWIDGDLAPGGRCHQKHKLHKYPVMTRFPPEPNGYLHIGHAKSILTNFGLAQKYGGRCNLRFDDTNPETEETEYVESIKEDVCWVAEALDMEECKNGGKPWGDNLFFASDYFDKMWEFAVALINEGKAYVDSQTPEEVTKNRGGGAENAPGIDSPFRKRLPAENLKLFKEMQAGKHEEGKHLLRAKIDMQSPNMNLRDPPIYRIRFASHHRTGDKWKVYPIYDFAHGNEDAIEGVTHSICTLEFENHNALYRWFMENTSIIPSKPVQKEFARLEVEGAVTSKRKLLALVGQNKVNGWDDPRLLTVCGLRRRGVRPQALKRLTDMVGVTNSNSVTPWDLVEGCFREDMEPISIRRQVVLDPLAVEISTYAGKTETIDGLMDLPSQTPEANPGCSRGLTMSSSIFIDKSDFVEDAPEGFFRLGNIGSEVKLRYSYVIKLEEIVKDKKGNVTKLRCSHDPETRDVMPERKPKVIHWVNSKDCIDVDVNLINPLFLAMPSTMPAGKTFIDYLNPEAMVTCKAKAEPALAKLKQSDRFQFERVGFFSPDYECFDAKKKKLVFNRVVGLKETTAKQAAEGKTGASRKDAQAAAAAEKARLTKIPPAEFFKSERGDEFSAYDENGLPTHDKKGDALPKSAVKKLQKDLEKQAKLFESSK